MQHIPRIIFSLAFLLYLIYPLSAQKIRFVDYVCNGCEQSIPPKKKADLEIIISSDNDLDTASNKVQPFFRPNLGDRYMLFCLDCKKSRTIIFPPSPQFKRSTIRAHGYLASKGAKKVYTLDEATKIMNDSVAVLASFKMDFSSMAYRNDEWLAQSQVGYMYKGENILKQVDYDRKSKVMTFSPQTVFGMMPEPAVADTMKLYFLYQDGQQLRKYTLSLNFLAAEEKQELKMVADYYKLVFPNWTAQEIARELTPIILNKYNYVQENDVTEWLKIPESK